MLLNLKSKNTGKIQRTCQYGHKTAWNDLEVRVQDAPYITDLDAKAQHGDSSTG